MGHWIAIIVLALVALPVLGLALLSAFSPRPPVGLVDGRLRPCPDKPNCVCSQADDPPQRIDPLPIDGDAAAAWGRLKSAVAAQPGVRIVAETDNYVHAEATTRVFRFVDDLEFLLSPEEGVIHQRSASRAGHSDLGVNRKRLEAIRGRMEEVRSEK